MNILLFYHCMSIVWYNLIIKFFVVCLTKCNLFFFLSSSNKIFNATSSLINDDIMRYMKLKTKTKKITNEGKWLEVLYLIDNLPSNG